jgi:hypothetical protein
MFCGISLDSVAMVTESYNCAIVCIILYPYHEGILKVALWYFYMLVHTLAACYNKNKILAIRTAKHIWGDFSLTAHVI